MTRTTDRHKLPPSPRWRAWSRCRGPARALSWCLAGWVSTAPAAALEWRVTTPAVQVSVPGLPEVALSSVRRVDPSAAAHWQGRDAGLDVDVALPEAPAEATPRSCARQVLGTVLAQPGMPARDNVYRAPLDPTTFLVIYRIETSQPVRLHAHLISSADERHCLAMQLQRDARDGEDDDDWRQAFRGAHIEPATR